MTRALSKFALPAPVSALSLFLDFDGTLVPIAPEPGAIAVPARLPGLLERAAERLDRRLVLVSGRTIADIDGHLGAHEIPVVGSHGLEARLAKAAGWAAEPVDGDALEAALRARLGDAPGILIERKRFGLAVHFRRAPDSAALVETATAQAAERFGLARKPGKMVVELTARGDDKGDAVRRIMARPGFSGTRPLYVGDDRTDEDGFAAAHELGGLGVLVGERDPTRAGARLPGPRAVHALLNEIAESPR